MMSPSQQRPATDLRARFERYPDTRSSAGDGSERWQAPWFSAGPWGSQRRPIHPFETGSNTAALDFTGVALSNPLIGLQLVAGQLGEFAGGYRTEERRSAISRTR